MINQLIKSSGSLGGLAAIILNSFIISGCNDDNNRNQNSEPDNYQNNSTNSYIIPATNSIPEPVTPIPVPVTQPEPRQIPQLQSDYIGGHMYQGDSDSVDFDVEPGKKYAAWYGYSNDDNAQLDKVAFYADNECLGILDPPQDTGDWGYGWANEVDSPVYRFETKHDQTKVRMKIKVLRADQYGFRTSEVFIKRVQ